jgi:hypothetical protein
MTKQLYKNAVIILIFFIAPMHSAKACSVIRGTDSSKILVGSNEDNYYSDPFIWFTKASDKKYGCAFFSYDIKYTIGFLKLPISGKIAPQQALNDKGLYYDFLGTPYHEIKKTDDMRKGHQIKAIKEMMYECKNVEEAIIFLDSQYSRFFRGCKIFIADKTGDYVIYDGKDYIKKGDKKYCITTNFIENKEELGNYPCPRYTKATELFAANNEISIPNFTSILNAVHQNSDDLEMGTFYSLICDLKTGNVNLFQFQDYEHKYTLNIQNELKKGTKVIRLRDLFAKRSFPILFNVLVKKGAEAAINKFNELQNDERYNKSESELIFFSKALYNYTYYQEAEKIINLCIEKYPDSLVGKEISYKITLKIKV